VEVQCFQILKAKEVSMWGLTVCSVWRAERQARLREWKLEEMTSGQNHYKPKPKARITFDSENFQVRRFGLSLLSDIITRFVIITAVYLLLFGFVVPRYIARVDGWRAQLSPTTVTLLVICSLSIVLFISVIFDLWRFHVLWTKWELSRWWRELAATAQRVGFRERNVRGSAFSGRRGDGGGEWRRKLLWVGLWFWLDGCFLSWGWALFYAAHLGGAPTALTSGFQLQAV
jgi:hypothetical protein